MSSWSDVCYWGYGIFNLKPNELYDLEPVELLEMVNAYISAKNDDTKEQMSMMAWQTSIIINCMGTLKKKVKPTDLFNPDADKDTPKGIKVIGEDEHSKLQEELLNSFK